LNPNSQQKLLVITCECGFQIPIASDAQAVGIAIDQHIEEHRQNDPNPQKTEHIQEYLFTELFKKIDKITILP
jgi:hypothetical protein